MPGFLTISLYLCGDTSPSQGGVTILFQLNYAFWKPGSRYPFVLSFLASLLLGLCVTCFVALLHLLRHIISSCDEDTPRIFFFSGFFRMFSFSFLSIFVFPCPLHFSDSNIDNSRAWLSCVLISVYMELIPNQCKPIDPTGIWSPI